MNNDDAYAQGLLNRALEPARQPQAIRTFLEDESALIRELIPEGSRVIDFGCGMGRHLMELSNHVASSVGIDYEAAYIGEAVKAAALIPHLQFLEADATEVPLYTTFDVAMCLMNTWGTMSNKPAVLREMNRLSPKAASRLLTVFVPTSIPARSEWYSNIGYQVLDVTDEHIVTSGGFMSEHFAEDRLRALLGPCVLHQLGEIACVAQF